MCACLVIICRSLCVDFLVDRVVTPLTLTQQFTLHYHVLVYIAGLCVWSRRFMWPKNQPFLVPYCSKKNTTECVILRACEI